jgi:uncharacterized membrane protein (UPF0127 family)
MKIYCNNYLLADKVSVADNFFSRFKGLMGKSCIGSGEGLLLMNCPSIHCFFMKTTIDAVYLTKDLKVIGVETLSPWSLGKRFKDTAHVLELGAGCARVRAGNVLKIVRH